MLNINKLTLKTNVAFIKIFTYNLHNKAIKEIVIFCMNTLKNILTNFIL